MNVNCVMNLLDQSFPGVAIAAARTEGAWCAAGLMLARVRRA